MNIDGTYATQSALMEKGPTSASISSTSTLPSLRSLLLAGDFFLAAVLATTLTKLALKATEQKMDMTTKNLIVVRVLLINTCILRLGESHLVQTTIDPDSYDRITLCIKILSKPSPFAK